MIDTIFLDLDDVCNSFTMSALREVGCPVGEYDYRQYDPIWKFDIVRAANELHPTMRFTDSFFWRELSWSFWRSCPPSKELPWLLKECEHLVGKDNICILTAAPKKVGSFVPAAKAQWIRRYLPPWLHEQYLIGTKKKFCARPSALLIDDADHNIEAFKRAGGKAILLPRPWNSLHEASVMVTLQLGLSRLSLKGAA